MDKCSNSIPFCKYLAVVKVSKFVYEYGEKNDNSYHICSFQKNNEYKDINGAKHEALCIYYLNQLCISKQKSTDLDKTLE